MSKRFTNNLPRDASTGIIQEANNFITDNGSQTSPMTLTGGVDSIAIPANGAELVLYPVTHDLKVSEDSSMSSYDLVSKNNKEPFPCAGMSVVYIQGTMSDILYFRIHEV